MFSTLEWLIAWGEKGVYGAHHMKPWVPTGVTRDMRQFAVLSLAVALVAFGHAINPLERMAASQATSDAAKPYLRSATYKAAKESLDQVQFAYKEYNQGIAEMRLRRASNEEPIAFANATRNGVEVRHSERVWGFLSNHERSLMTRLAMKTIGPEILRFEEAGAMVGVSRRESAQFALQYRADQDHANKVLRALYATWTKQLSSNPLPMERYEIDKEYRKKHDAALAELNKAKAKIGQEIVNSLIAAQRKRWIELTTLPRP